MLHNWVQSIVRQVRGLGATTAYDVAATESMLFLVCFGTGACQLRCLQIGQVGDVPQAMFFHPTN